MKILLQRLQSDLGIQRRLQNLSLLKVPNSSLQTNQTKHCRPEINTSLENMYKKVCLNSRKEKLTVEISSLGEEELELIEMINKKKSTYIKDKRMNTRFKNEMKSFEQGKNSRTSDLTMKMTHTTINNQGSFRLFKNQ